MISKIWLINFILALFVAFFGFRAYGVWSREQPNIHTSPKSGKTSTTVQRPGSLSDKRPTPPEKDYAVLMNQNLFSPERREILPEEKKPAQAVEKLQAAEEKNLENMLDKMVLYGLVITEDSAKALVSDVSFKPVVRMGRQLKLKKLSVGKTKWVKPGDTVGEFKVTKVEKDRIRLEVKGNGYDLLLYDKEKLKPHAPVTSTEVPKVVGAAQPQGEKSLKSTEEKPPVPQQKELAPPAVQPPKKQSPTVHKGSEFSKRPRRSRR
jgi:hypothetical protein